MSNTNTTSENNNTKYFLGEEGLNIFWNKILSTVDDELKKLYTTYNTKYLSADNLISNKNIYQLLPFELNYDNKLKFKVNEKYFNLQDGNKIPAEEYGKLTLNILGITNDDSFNREIDYKLDNKIGSALIEYNSIVDNKIGSALIEYNKIDRYYYFLNSNDNKNGNNFMLGSDVDCSPEKTTWIGTITSNNIEINFKDYNNLTFILNSSDFRTDIINIANSIKINSNTLSHNKSCSFIIANASNYRINLLNNIGQGATSNKIIINSINEDIRPVYIKYGITNLGFDNYLINIDGYNNNSIYLTSEVNETNEIEVIDTIDINENTENIDI